MLRSSVFLCGLLLLVLVCVDVASARSAVKRHPRSLQASQANAVDNLSNSDFNGVVNASLGHYFIYYGERYGAGGDDEATPAALKQFIADISDSPYMNINTQYYGRSLTDYATRQVHWVGESIVGAPYGTTISDKPERCGLKILERLLLDASRNIPFDATTQYYMIYGSDITISNAERSCGDQGACGLHNQQYITKNGVKTKYLNAWVKNEAGCVGEPVQQLKSPNANAGVQSVIDTLAHEIVETITDPNQLPSSDRAWQDSQGSEISDKCTTYYGTPIASTKISGAFYNVLANGNEYMIQGQWSNEISGCSLARAITDATPSASLPAGASPSGSAPVAATPSNSGAAPVSASNVASPSPSSSNFPAADPTSACITCNRPVCKKVKKVSKVCTKTLGGTWGNGTTANQKCCTGITAFKSFGWSVGAQSCDELYEAPYRKLNEFCDNLGGRATCDRLDDVIRLTCQH
jgi:cell division septation protein DedD